MEKRLKISFHRGGGKNGRPGGEGCRLSLPITWIRELGIKPEEPYTKVTLVDGKIIIEKDSSK